MWTIEAFPTFDAVTFETYTAWAVIDEDGREIEFFRNRGDAEGWLMTKFGISAGGA